MLDIDGHVKLTDFGLSKEKVSRNFCSLSFCGSPEYMSPEMLSRQGHGLPVDLYSLGALLYEMLTGLPPHYSRNRQQMYQQILHNLLAFPPFLSDNAIDLLSNLLSKDPDERMKISDLKAHPFLADIDWKKLEERMIPPPEPLDIRVSHFDPEYTSMNMSWKEEVDMPDDKPRSHSFVEIHHEAPHECEATMFAIDTPELICDVPSTMTKSIVYAKNKKGKGFKCPNKLEYLHKKEKDLFFSGNPFAGYEFSRDIYQKEIERKRETGIIKKTFSIQAPSVRGESNDQDIVVPDSDDNNSAEEENNVYIEEDEREVKSSVSLATKQRCISAENLSNCPKNTAIIQVIPQTHSKKKWPNKSSTKAEISAIEQKNFVQAQEKAQFETCKLINGQKSNVNANLIKLNDDLNGVVSERKRWQKKTPENDSKKKEHNLKDSNKRIKKQTTSSNKKEINLNPRKPIVNEDVSGWTADTQMTSNDPRLEMGLVNGFLSRKISASHAQSSIPNVTRVPLPKEECKSNKNYQHRTKNFTASVSSLGNKILNMRKSRQLFFSPIIQNKNAVTVNKS